MRKLLLALVVSSISLVARAEPSCDFDGSCGSETERYIQKEINKTSGLSGRLLKETRKNENKLIQNAINESPTLQRYIRDAGKNRSWRDYYSERLTDANVSSFGNFIKAGYLRGTAAAYATYKTLPPGIDVVAAAVPYALGVLGGLFMAAVDIAVHGHF